MRKVLITLTILLVACLQVARADVNPNAAPADEYFGPYKQSILEICNRLNDYDIRDDGAMLDPSVPSYLDHLQLAILDWRSKYPRDPWLPKVFAHLIREYWRAGQASSDHGMAALATMRSTYPDAPETAATVSLVYGSNAALAGATRDGADVLPAENAEPAGDVAAAPDPTLPSYATPVSDVAPSSDGGSAADAVTADDVPTPPPAQ
jgi:hypothetical protein